MSLIRGGDWLFGPDDEPKPMTLTGRPTTVIEAREPEEILREHARKLGLDKP